MQLSLLFVSVHSFASVSNWSGFYLGGNVGESIDSTNAQTSMYSDGGVAAADYVTAFNAAGNQLLDFNNFIAGVQAGYNYQLNNWVIGLETNYDPSTQATASQTSWVSGQVTGAYAGNGVTSIEQSIYQNWNFTVRSRIGYVVSHFLLYATGGFALADVNDTSYTNWNSTLGYFNNVNQTASVLPGWAAGAGIEWKITPQHWSLNAQYLYEGFEHINNTTLLNASPANLIEPDPNASVSQKDIFNSNVLTVGINYFF